MREVFPRVCTVRAVVELNRSPPCLRYRPKQSLTVTILTRGWQIIGDRSIKVINSPSADLPACFRTVCVCVSVCVNVWDVAVGSSVRARWEKERVCIAVRNQSLVLLLAVSGSDGVQRCVCDAVMRPCAVNPPQEPAVTHYSTDPQQSLVQLSTVHRWRRNLWSWSVLK